MFSHIMLGANDIEQSKKFYDALMAVLGYEAGYIDDKGRCFYRHPDGVFAITKPIDGEPAGPGNGMTIGFKVSDPKQGDAWHEAGLANGGTTCEDPPGIRENNDRKIYLAYLRDPAGNKLCAAHLIK